MTDRISLLGVRARGFHGVLADEKRDGQDFVIDVVLHVDLVPAGTTDDLALTINYAEVGADVAGDQVGLGVGARALVGLDEPAHALASALVERGVGALGLVEGDELVIVDPRGAHGLTLPPGTRLPLTTRAPITTAAREGKPAWAQRRQELTARFPDTPPLAPYASGALGVPVFVGERLAGSMGFPFVEPDAITPEVRTVARIDPAGTPTCPSA